MKNPLNAQLDDLRFDVLQAPPSQAEIELARAQIQREDARLKRWLYALIAVSAAAMIATWSLGGSQALFDFVSSVLFLSFAVTIVLASVADGDYFYPSLVVCAVTGTFALSDAGAFAVAGGVGGGVAGTVAFKLIEAIERVRARSYPLAPSPREHCVDVANWCADPAVDSYREKVVASRLLVNADVMAMRDWVEGAQAREDAARITEKIDRACRAVYVGPQVT